MGIKQQVDEAVKTYWREFGTADELSLDAAFGEWGVHAHGHGVDGCIRIRTPWKVDLDRLIVV